tara:strand:+ start:350 stop:703 length:354 start_codon:yes stop_codon:yes gene_type:complete
MQTTHYKQDEIQSHINDYIKENEEYLLESPKDIQDLHNDIFNMDYYLIGYYNCEKWLDNKVFDAIEVIQEYEKEHFGEVTTDLSSSEKVVNMYTYIIGEKLLYEMEKDLLKKQLIRD